MDDNLATIDRLTRTDIKWPPKKKVFGVGVSQTTYDQVVDCLTDAAENQESAIASFVAVHALITMARDPRLRSAAEQFEIVAPDGQPVRWAMNLLHGARLRDRVYGPELTLRLCQAAAEKGLPIYLYGGTDVVLKKLREKLKERCPDLVIAGSYAPPFRPLMEDEKDEVIDSISNSGARIVFIGLGAPKQDLFAAEFRERLDVVWVCVGAAFDFHAGVKAMAPAWMQRLGLEWLFRLQQEPRRLAGRYVTTNSLFLMYLAQALAGKLGSRIGGPSADRN